MRNFSTELKVGIFAIIVIFFLSYMTFKVGGLPALWEKGYRLYVEFDDVSGLDEQSRIKVAGVDAGIIEKISLESGKAKVTLLVNPEIRVYKNAEASLRMSGLLGDRYLAVSTGTPDKPVLRDGDKIENVATAADIDVLANRASSAADHISDLAKNINSVFGEEEKQAIKDTIYNLETLTSRLNEMTEENRKSVRNMIAKLEEFTEALNERGPGVLDNLDTAANELKDVIEENRHSFRKSMENIRRISESTRNITGKIERGEGTIGKLVTEEELYDSLDKITKEAGKALDFAGRIRTFMDFRGEYNETDREWKGYFDLTLQPSRDKYYIIGVVDDEVGSVETTTTVQNGVTTVEKETKSRVEFSAQIAKRYGNLALRIGMLENTFGIGSDYFFNDERGRARVDVWDFAAREADAERAHARIGVDYGIFRHVFVSGGVDNLFNSGRRGIYLGGGFKFEDKDFKYLLGSTPDIPLN